MTLAAFQAPEFHDEDKAREALEALRWPDGPICPHCGNSDQEKIAKIAGEKQSHRPGLHYCNECKGQFTVTVGTVFERSKVPLTKWWIAAHMLNSGKKGVSAHQVHRTIGVTYKTAWFMMHRLREAMADLKPTGPMGGPGKIVEADTTYIGGKESNKHRSKRNSRNIGGKGKQIVHTLVERDGTARSHHVASIGGDELRPILTANVSRKSSLMTDTAGGYMGVGKEFARHEMVDHGIGEYVRGDAYSNTVERLLLNSQARYHWRLPPRQRGPFEALSGGV
jgi:transposase-like protein